jgi:hypothetical protein
VVPSIILDQQGEYMEHDLYKEYILIKNGEKKANSFSKLIKNNDILKKELYDKSKDIILYYESPSDIQRLKFVFGDNSISFCKCGKPRSWRNFNKGYNKTCGNKQCIIDSNNSTTKKFYQEKYGVDHLFQTEDFKNELKNKFILKYGVDNPRKSEEIKNKIKETNLGKYGETSWIKVKENKEKIADSLSKKNHESGIKKIKDLKIPIVLNGFNLKDVEIECKVCQDKSLISTSFFNKKISIGENPCLSCNPPVYSESKSENELLEYIKQIYKGDIIVHDRKILEGKEIDIFLPDINTGFEFHGIWWHSEIFKGKNGNIDKKKLIEEKGIKIYHIWEDNWCYKKEITKSRILNALKLSSKIYARKCKIDTISSKIEKEFLENNHIQGYTPSKIKLGLYYKNELVSIMTFGSRRKSLGQKSKEGEYELLRFCNKKFTSVIGGASKIFNKFIKDYNSDLIISYQDNSWYTGNLYEKLGFNLISKSKPNYYWCKTNIRFHRFNFRKDLLVNKGFDKNKTEDMIMTERGYYKLWDFGNLKWEYKKKGLV